MRKPLEGDFQFLSWCDICRYIQKPWKKNIPMVAYQHQTNHLFIVPLIQWHGK